MNEKSIVCNRNGGNPSGHNPACTHSMPTCRQGSAGPVGMRRTVRSGTHMNFHAGKDSGSLNEVICNLKVYGDRSIF